MGARPCLAKESLTGVGLVSLDNDFARSLAQVRRRHSHLAAG